MFSSLRARASSPPALVQYSALQAPPEPEFDPRSLNWTLPRIGDKESIVEFDDVSKVNVTFNAGKWVAVGPSGGTVAVYAYEDGDTTSIHLMGRRPSGFGGRTTDTWETLAVLSPPTEDSYFTEASLTFFGRGDVAITYVQVFDLGAGSEQRFCRVTLVEGVFTDSPTSTDWLLATSFDETGALYPAIASDEDGGLHAVYPSRLLSEADTHINYAYLAPGASAWSIEELSSAAISGIEHNTPSVAASASTGQVLVAWKQLGTATTARAVYWTSADMSLSGFPAGSFRAPRLLAGNGTSVDKAFDPSVCVTPGGRFYVAFHAEGGQGMVVEGSDPVNSGLSSVGDNQFTTLLAEKSRFFHLVADDDFVFNVWPAHVPEAPWPLAVFWSIGEVASGTTVSTWTERGALTASYSSELAFSDAYPGPGQSFLLGTQTGEINVAETPVTVTDWDGVSAAGVLGTFMGESVSEMVVGAYAVIREDGYGYDDNNVGSYLITDQSGASLELAELFGDIEPTAASGPVAFTIEALSMGMRPSIALGPDGDLHVGWLETSVTQPFWDEINPTGALCYVRIKPI